MQFANTPLRRATLNCEHVEIIVHDRKNDASNIRKKAAVSVTIRTELNFHR